MSSITEGLTIAVFAFLMSRFAPEWMHVTIYLGSALLYMQISERWLWREAKKYPSPQTSGAVWIRKILTTISSAILAVLLVLSIVDPNFDVVRYLEIITGNQ